MTEENEGMGLSLSQLFALSRFSKELDSMTNPQELRDLIISLLTQNYMLKNFLKMEARRGFK
jgi:hypothetical protein